MSAQHGVDSSAQHYPPQVLRDYALIADGERGALVGPRGDIVWLCAPRWHDDAVLSDLLGGRGTYAVSPRQRFVWGGSYVPGSLVWRNRWTTDDDRVTECHEALALPADRQLLVLMRRVMAVAGDADVRVSLDLRAGFGTHATHDLSCDDDGRWTGRTGGLRFRFAGAADARVEDGALIADLHVPAGRQHDLVLEISAEALPEPTSPDRLWSQTMNGWQHRVPDLAATIAPRDARHAVAVLHGLTSSSGGMVAAATLGLPERVDRGRDYDYRYAWVRDQCYAGLAAAAAGADDLLDGAVSFVSARLLDDGPHLRPAYLVDGARVPDQRELDLPGYPGGCAVVGNHANDQWQLDAVGEVLQLLSAAAERDRLDDDGRRALQVGIEVVARRWEEPDAGIWELGDDWWAQSRLSCVAGLRRAAAVGAGSDVARAAALADELLAETSRRCLDTAGVWQRSPERTGVDAALVLPPVRGALPADDPRTRATLAAVQHDLVQEHYCYRFRHGATPLAEAEGAFAVCGLFVALAMEQQGRHVEAARWFERNRAACGPPGLLSEEFDVQQRQLRGNLPQAFVHALLLESAAALAAGMG